MKLKKFDYKSTPQTRAAARAYLDYEEGRTASPKGFTTRLVLDPAYIKETRKKLGLTQRELGQLLSVETTTVEKWEQGRRFPENPVVKLLMLLPKHPQLKKWLEELRTPVAVSRTVALVLFLFAAQSQAFELNPLRWGRAQATPTATPTATPVPELETVKVDWPNGHPKARGQKRRGLAEGSWRYSSKDQRVQVWGEYKAGVPEGNWHQRFDDLHLEITGRLQFVVGNTAPENWFLLDDTVADKPWLAIRHLPVLPGWLDADLGYSSDDKGSGLSRIFHSVDLIYSPSRKLVVYAVPFLGEETCGAAFYLGGSSRRLCTKGPWSDGERSSYRVREREHGFEVVFEFMDEEQTCVETYQLDLEPLRIKKLSEKCGE